jgi:hypothetical protein
MKKLIFLLLLCIPTIGFSQGLFKDFWKPVRPTSFNATNLRPTGVDMSIEWKIRSQLSLTGLQWNYDKEVKKLTSKTLTSAGLGLGVQHYRNINTAPFNDYGAYLLVLYGQQLPVTDFSTNSLSLALVFNGLGIINIGPVFDLGSNKLGLLTGVSIKF